MTTKNDINFGINKILLLVYFGFLVLLSNFSYAFSIQRISIPENFNNYKHVAFPDVTEGCSNQTLLAFRVGNSHANDKGSVIVGELLDTTFVTLHEIGYKSFDLRNPYFMTDKDKIILFTSIYDFENQRFSGSQINGFRCIDGKLVFESKSVVGDIIYDPNVNTGSYTKETFSLFGKQRFNLSNHLQSNKFLMVPDEEISFRESELNIIGIGRNSKKAGLPLLLYKGKKNSEKLDYTDYSCTARIGTALVAPRLDIDGDQILLHWSGREITDKDPYSNKNRLFINVMKFDSYESLISCKYSEFISIGLDASIDGGYTAYSKIDNSYYFYAQTNFDKQFHIYRLSID